MIITESCTGALSGISFLLHNFFVGLRSILWGRWHPLFRTSNDSVHWFHSQDAFIVTYTLLSLVHSNPQSHLWLPGLRIELGLLAREASMIPCYVIERITFNASRYCKDSLVPWYFVMFQRENTMLAYCVIMYIKYTDILLSISALVSLNEFLINH